MADFSVDGRGRGRGRGRWRSRGRAAKIIIFKL